MTRDEANPCLLSRRGALFSAAEFGSEDGRMNENRPCAKQTEGWMSWLAGCGRQRFGYLLSLVRFGVCSEYPGRQAGRDSEAWLGFRRRYSPNRYTRLRKHRASEFRLGPPRSFFLSSLARANGPPLIPPPQANHPQQVVVVYSIQSRRTSRTVVEQSQ